MSDVGDEPQRTRPPFGFWSIAVLVVCLVAGLLIATTREVSHGNEIRAADSTRLSDLVRQAQTEVDRAARTRDELAAQVEELQETAAGTDTRVAEVLTESRALADAAGLTELSGRGVVVTLTDAPRDADGKYPAGASPDDLVVHQQDVQSVLNALWAGGAEAVAMQDQRIVNTSAPRCIGNTLLLHGRTYSPPYVVTAIGDPARLAATLANEPGIKMFKQYAVRYGLGYTQQQSDALTVPAYTGQLHTEYARPVA
ncbi:DUF881 domain-containing protein [Rhodococcus hoagii]|uniref:DUF881 domain-containing protein n=2 Tax=Rhodococcus hoagii TaxID=43767 RepID=E9T841_RHOHA|nr:DUF881 domain-containing protein [Prescottella equi]MBU4615815.1 DUF881 domain-containing protein [Rhodococcus sp. GG48]GBF16544.1 hypothetical protein Br6_03939 [Rhodococcus sp. Br-6]AVP66492.1 DUF881 domain-containing protein [Prescottella equi]EGD21445.1 hypothetical protein HMPREF0724_14947 [Prescottella equi ATCC 33707]ERN47973.1 membrane protein [Prescottella equi NBRC 101255 = C 7]